MQPTQTFSIPMTIDDPLNLIFAAITAACALIGAYVILKDRVITLKIRITCETVPGIETSIHLAIMDRNQIVLKIVNLGSIPAFIETAVFDDLKTKSKVFVTEHFGTNFKPIEPGRSASLNFSKYRLLTYLPSDQADFEIRLVITLENGRTFRSNSIHLKREPSSSQPTHPERQK